MLLKLVSHSIWSTLSIMWSFIWLNSFLNASIFVSLFLINSVCHKPSSWIKLIIACEWLCEFLSSSKFTLSKFFVNLLGLKICWLMNFHIDIKADCNVSSLISFPLKRSSIIFKYLINSSDSKTKLTSASTASTSW